MLIIVSWKTISCRRLRFFVEILIRISKKNFDSCETHACSSIFHEWIKTQLLVKKSDLSSFCTWWCAKSFHYTLKSFIKCWDQTSNIDYRLNVQQTISRIHLYCIFSNIWQPLCCLPTITCVAYVTKSIQMRHAFVILCFRTLFVD